MNSFVLSQSISACGSLSTDVTVVRDSGDVNRLNVSSNILPQTFLPTHLASIICISLPISLISSEGCRSHRLNLLIEFTQVHRHRLHETRLFKESRLFIFNWLLFWHDRVSLRRSRPPFLLFWTEASVPYGY